MGADNNFGGFESLSKAFLVSSIDFVLARISFRPLLVLPNMELGSKSLIKSEAESITGLLREFFAQSGGDALQLSLKTNRFTTAKATAVVIMPAKSPNDLSIAFKLPDLTQLLSI